jgi:hypothetical protein
MNHRFPLNRSPGLALGVPRFLSTGLVLLALVGCGNLTAGGAGEAEVFVDGGGPDEGGEGSAAPYPALSMATLPAHQGDLALEGGVTVGLRVFLLTPEGGVQEISGGPREVTVDVQGSLPETLGAVSIPDGVYAATRIEFHRVEAEVTGLLDSEGTPLAGLIRVDFEGEEVLVVDRPLSVAVDEGTRLVLTVHLRSDAWLGQVDPETLLVPAGAFQAAVAINTTVTGS